MRKTLNVFNGKRLALSLGFNLHDLWVGVYWTSHRLALSPASNTFAAPCVRTDVVVWLCLLPCLPLALTFKGREIPAGAEELED